MKNDDKCTFYDYDYGIVGTAFEVDKNDKQISVHKIEEDFYVRVDEGRAETAQIVFTAVEFAAFVDRCTKMIAAGK